MHFLTKSLVTLAAMLCVTTTTLGASYRIDFSGSTLTPNENFSGYAILDYSIVGSGSSSDEARYIELVTHIEVQVNGVNFVMASNVTGSGDRDGVVINDSAFYGADVFYFAAAVVSTTDPANTSSFLLQLRDSSNSVFSDTSLPSDLTLTNFDPYNPIGIFSTGVFLPTSPATLVPLDFVQITQVPLPGGLLLLLSGLTTMLSFRFSSQV